MSLTTCLKKMGATISPKDRAAILSLARGYRSQGLDPTAAAIQAVSDQAEIAQSRLAELSTADRPVESTPLPSKRADTPQTETENFKRWFGDSKVVDAEGKPLVVYHGTDREFTEFRMGSAPGWGRGIYFTDNRDQAEADYGGGAGGRVVEAYLSIRNPWRGGFPGYEEVEGTRAWQGYTGRFEDSLDAWDEDGRFAGEVLRELGYDGVIAENSNDIRGLEIVAFDPGQIKSATGNNGQFDPGNPDIRFSRRKSDADLMARQQAAESACSCISLPAPTKPKPPSSSAGLRGAKWLTQKASRWWCITGRGTTSRSSKARGGEDGTDCITSQRTPA